MSAWTKGVPAPPVGAWYWCRSEDLGNQPGRIVHVFTDHNGQPCVRSDGALHMADSSRHWRKFEAAEWQPVKGPDA